MGILVYVQDGSRVVERLIAADLCRAEGAFMHFFKKRTVTVRRAACSGGIWPFRWSVPERDVQSTVEDFVTAIAARIICEIAPASGMEAGTGETEGLDPKDDSPVHEVEPPKPGPLAKGRK